MSVKFRFSEAAVLRRFEEEQGGADLNAEHEASVSQGYKRRLQQRESLEKEQIREGIYQSPGTVGGGTQLSPSCNISCPRFLENKHPRTNHVRVSR